MVVYSKQAIINESQKATHHGKQDHRAPRILSVLLPAQTSKRVTLILVSSAIAGSVNVKRIIMKSNNQKLEQSFELLKWTTLTEEQIDLFWIIHHAEGRPGSVYKEFFYDSFDETDSNNRRKWRLINDMEAAGFIIVERDIPTQYSRKPIKKYIIHPDCFEFICAKYRILDTSEDIYETLVDVRLTNPAKSIFLGSFVVDQNIMLDPAKEYECYHEDRSDGKYLIIKTRINSVENVV